MATAAVEDRRAASESPKRAKVSDGDKVWRYVCASRLLVDSSWDPWPEAESNTWQINPQDTERTRRTEVFVFGRKVDVTVTCEAAAVEEWIGRQEGRVFGVDLEWKPNRIRGEDDNKVALVQICSETECMIVQMLFLDQIPDALVNFLQDTETLLGGVGIKKDAEKLREDYSLVSKGLVELGSLAVKKLGDPDLRNTGLKKMANKVMGLSMDKPKRITMSNWAKRHLDTVQISYACVDAWISYAILQKLLST